MARITINHEGNEMELEGTPEEIKEMLATMGVKPAEEIGEDEGNEEASEEATEGFQAGDYVRVTQDVNEHREGDVLEIIVRDNRPLEYGVRNTRIFPKSSAGRTGWIDEEDFEPIEYIEGAPEVGDKILVVNKRGALGEYRNGDVLTVTEVKVSFVRVEEEGYHPVIFRDEFEIIERATAESSFEVGDLAVITEEAYEGRLEIGDVVEIIGTGRFFDFEAKRLTDGHVEYFDTEELAEYVPEEKELSVGDKVVLAIPKGENPEYGFGKVKNGDIGEVLNVYGGGGGLSIKFESRPVWTGLTSEVLLVEEAKPAAEVGDIIRITDYRGGAKVGEIVEVQEVRDDLVNYSHYSATTFRLVAEHGTYEIVAKSSDRIDEVGKDV